MLTVGATSIGAAQPGNGNERVEINDRPLLSGTWPCGDEPDIPGVIYADRALVEIDGYARRVSGGEGDEPEVWRLKYNAQSTTVIDPGNKPGSLIVRASYNDEVTVEDGLLYTDLTVRYTHTNSGFNQFHEPGTAYRRDETWVFTKYDGGIAFRRRSELSDPEVLGKCRATYES